MNITKTVELTLDHELLKSPHYHKIKEIIAKLTASNMAQNMSGNCISSSEIMQHLLTQVGISCRIIECQVCLIRNGTNNLNDILFVGYDDQQYTGQIDTHTVIVTEGENPLIIDMSLSYALPKDHPYIVERVKTSENIIGEYNVGNINITYFNKKNIKLNKLHQKTLLERYFEDEHSKKKFNTLEKVVYICAAITTINFALNVLLIILKIYTDFIPK